MNVPMLDLTVQHAALREPIAAGLAAVLDSGRFVLGPNVEAFEREAAAFLGVAHAVSCASGTDALHLALCGLEIGPGDEVITTAFTFAATAEAIHHVGARPRFVDIDAGSFNIDPVQVEAAIGPATRAIIPVHAFGRPAPMAALRRIAARHGLYLIEDCAQSFGALSGSERTGSLGDAGCFSFFPSKNLGACGDGGMVTTGSAALAATLRELRNHGCPSPYRHRIIGYNSRLDEMQAVILRIKLERVEAFNRARRRIAQCYSEKLADVPGLATPTEDLADLHVYHQYTVLHPERDRLAGELAKRDVASAVYYRWPLHRQPAFAADADGTALPATDWVAERCLSLPMYPELSDAQIDQVVCAVRAGLGGRTSG